jgi:hypothetical protein
MIHASLSKNQPVWRMFSPRFLPPPMAMVVWCQVVGIDAMTDDTEVL